MADTHRSGDRGADAAHRRNDPERNGPERERLAHGLPDYHDPTAGIGGAPPSLSALSLRLVLAVFGLIVCTGGAVLAAMVSSPVGFTVLLAVLAAVALGDIAVIVRRKRRGEPG